MITLDLRIDGSRTAFAPGEILRGVASWMSDAVPRDARVELLWYTSGKGTQDVHAVATYAIDNPKLTDERPFQFTLPQEPYSFSGRLISVCWAIELVLNKGDDVQRVEFVLSPTGKEIDITTGQVHPELRKPKAKALFQIGK